MQRCRKDFTVRGLVSELAERGLKVDYRTMWMNGTLRQPDGLSGQRTAGAEMLSGLGHRHTGQLRNASN
jgi:hypothetical protein